MMAYLQEIFIFLEEIEKEKKGELYRESLKEFILHRMKNECVNPFIYLNIFDGENVSCIKLPECYTQISLDELDSIFKGGSYRGFFNIVK